MADLSGQVKTKLIVKFYERAVPQSYLSIQNGKPDFKTVVYCQIITPGALTIVDRPMYPNEDELKYPDAWAAFKNGKRQEMDGTPLDKWAGSRLDISDIKQLEAVGYYTVESVAGMPDFDIGKVRGGHDLKRRAQMFLEAAKGSGQTDRLMAEIQQAKEDSKAKDDVIKSMSERLAVLEAAKEKSSKPHRAA
ncbi:MAG: hypothetical protein JNK86_04670 [Alphaproteobacteria bacterium]|nr:hypothetical protein [Alphaproteobacteria bacterium]